MLPVSPITEETLMILPVPRISMCSSAAWATKKAPDRLMETTRSQSSSPILATVLSMVIPALLTRMSRRPCCSMTSRTTRRQSSGSPMFPLWTVIVPGYSAFMSSVNFSAASCCRQYPAAMCAPSCARRWLMAAPMPRVPPVTRATRSSSRPGAPGGLASVVVVIVLLLSVSLAVAASWRTLGVWQSSGTGHMSRHAGPLVPDGWIIERPSTAGAGIALELRQHRRVTQRGHVSWLAVFRDVAQEPAHDLPGPGLGQVVGPDNPAGPGQLADLAADVLAQHGLEISLGHGTGSQGDVRHHRLAGQVVGGGDDRGLRDRGVRDQGRFDLGGGQPVAGDVDDVVDA